MGAAISPKTIRTTRSVCPKCLQTIDAFIVEKDNKVFMQKTCQLHGFFEILLSETAPYYSELEQYYFDLADERNEVPEYEIWPTYKCNIDCSICCFGKQNHEMEDQDASLSQIEQFIKNSSKRFFILSGGDPTCRDDLDQIIKLFRKYGKTVTINTNGLKCASINYLKKLKEAGLDRLNLQFDGFDRKAYIALRRQDYLDVKLKVIENLKTLNIQTTFNATIAKNLNENAVKDLIDFAAKHPFINGVNFFTICYLGGARDWGPDNYIMPDEIVDLLQQQTDHKVSKENVFIFQKLHLAIKSFLSQKWCFYNQVYLFVRDRGSYQPIDRYLNLAKAGPWLDKYRDAFIRKKFLSRFYLGMAVVCLFLKKESLVIFKEILLRGLSYFLKTQHYLKGSRFFSVSFSTGCDPYKFDHDIVKHCQNEIIAAQDATGILTELGSDGIYCMNLERRHLNKTLNQERTASP